MPDEQEKREPQEDGGSKMLPIIIGAIIIFAILTSWERGGGETERYTVSGVPIESEMPLDQLERLKQIALYNTTTRFSEYTCKFGLSAISQPSRQGYLIKFDEGPMGVKIGRSEAVISGSTGNDLLKACHAFACLREGIDCPQDMNSLRWVVENAQSMSVIIDEEAGARAGRGFAEIEGVLSFIQSKKLDEDEDGVFTQQEVDANEYFIYPFIMENNTCRMQGFNNLVQTLDPSNRTFDCDSITPAIVLEHSGEKSISREGDRIILRGDDEALHSAAIILRDVISPEWIRHVYNLR